MNLSTKTNGLIFVLALFLFSCTDFSTVGQEFIQDQVGEFAQASPSVETSVVILDSIPTDNAFFTGSFEEPVFGQISTTVFSELELDKIPNQESVQEGTYLDFQLVLVEDTAAFYGNFPAQQQINVHELSEGIEDTIIHYNFEEVPFQSEVLGTFNEPITLPLSDTLIIELNDQLGREFFANLNTENSDVFTDQEAFNEFFKGIALVSEGSNILSFRQALGSSSMRIRWRFDDEIRSYNLSFANASKFSKITNDLSGTALAGQPPSQAFIPTDGLIYTQVGTGISAKVNLESLDTFVDSVGQVVINQAELIIGPIITADEEAIQPPPTLNLFYANESDEILRANQALLQEFSNELIVLNNGYTLLPSGADLANFGNTSSVPFSLVYDPATQTYRGNLSIFLQELLSGKQFPSKQFLLNNGNISGSLRRFRVDPENVKINIFYTPEQ